MKGRARLLASLLLVAILASAAYVDSDRDEFLFDSLSWTQNPALRDVGQQWSELWQRPWKPTQGLATLSWALNGAFNRALGLPTYDVTSFLAFNIALHALTACLLLLVVRALLRRLDPDAATAVWIPLAAAAIFAAHPIHTSSVAYIVQRRGPMMAVFQLLGLLAYLRVRFPLGTIGRPQRALLLGALVACYWLCFQSKPVGVTMALALVAVEVCLSASRPGELRRVAPRLAVVSGLTLVAALLVGWDLGLFDPARLQILAVGERETWGVRTQLLTSARVFYEYWLLLVLPLPDRSNVDHLFTISSSVRDPGTLSALLVHALVLGWALVAIARRRTLAAIGVLWFYVALLPYALIPERDVMVEYKTYVPSVGFAFVVAELLRALDGRVSQRLQVAVVVSLTAVLFAATVRRSAVYHGSIALWTDALEKAPGNPRAHYNLGRAMFRAGREEEAARLYRRASEIDPGWFLPLAAQAELLAGRGELEAARRLYAAAVEANPDHIETRVNLGYVLLDLGRIDDARAHAEAALDTQMRRTRLAIARAHGLMGRVQAQAGDLEAARASYRAALERVPAMAEIRVELALALLELGHEREAIVHLRLAQRQGVDAARRTRERAQDWLGSGRRELGTAALRAARAAGS